MGGWLADNSKVVHEHCAVWDMSPCPFILASCQSKLTPGVTRAGREIDCFLRGAKAGMCLGLERERKGK
ncbi:hypothetical protein Ddc_08989 [Ditylenchus destructor]|nr:hypothetical protein Ddc_08989 [Ditylenchus destructor]